jgi:ribosomal protein S18 acetylase RimI-like enzyme
MQKPMSNHPQKHKAQIRLTTEADAEAYRKLRLLSLQQHPEAYGTDYVEQMQYPIETWRERMRNSHDGDSANFVAEVDSALVGMSVVVRDGAAKMRHTAHIYSVYLHPDWRGHGIARALIEACIAWTQERGLAQLKLSVVTTNVAAIGLYLRCGFSVYGVDPDVLRVGGARYDELLMVRRLVKAK